MDPRVIELFHRVLASPHEVREIFRAENEYYFRFLGVPMSILHGPRRDAKVGPYSFYLYPTLEKQSLAAISESSLTNHLEEPEMVPFHVADYAGEDQELFARVYDLMRQRNTNLDGLFERLLS